MFKPKSLKKGDKIGLVSPSGSSSEQELENAIQAVKKLGFEVVVTESCYSKYGYLAGSDALRAKCVNDLFEDKTINGIFCLRGGYGAQRILPLLNLNMIKQNPKFFAGYSDITALHNVFNQHCEFITYHSPMPTGTSFLNMEEFTKETFIKCVFTDEKLGVVNNPKDINIETLYEGVATGILTGGNLSVIVASIGTDYEINTKDKILFLEDIDEEPYRIDRMLVQLRNSGKLESVLGFILGCYTNCIPQNPDRSLTLNQIFKDIILPLKKPTIYNVVCGHCNPTMTLPLGSVVQIGNKDKINFI